MCNYTCTRVHDWFIVDNYFHNYQHWGNCDVSYETWSYMIVYFQLFLKNQFIRHSIPRFAFKICEFIYIVHLTHDVHK